MDLEKARDAAAKKATEWVENEMTIGLGTGRTVAYFLDHLSKKIKENSLFIQGVSSSNATSLLAKQKGISLLDINTARKIDLTIDGADEIDGEKRMIKGGGGALLREKILASSSGEMIVIVDEQKKVATLGKRKLPVEILPYGYIHTQFKITDFGYQGTWRLSTDGSHYITENSHFLYDIQFETPPLSMEAVHETLIHIPGVMETGFFHHLAGRVIVGHIDGSITIY